MRYPLLEKAARGRPLTEMSVEVRMPRNSTRRKITGGVIHFDHVSEDMVEMFAYGECTILATALYQITGWEFANVWAPRCGKPPSSCSRSSDCWNHVGVVIPGIGDFLDIRGPQTWPEALLHQRPGAFIEKTTLEQLSGEYYVPSSGRVDGFYDMHHSFQMHPLFGEAVLFLAEQIVARAEAGLPMARVA
jgi:hypothetical protein